MVNTNIVRKYRLKLYPKLIVISWLQGSQLILLSLNSLYRDRFVSKLSRIRWPPCIQLISIGFGYNIGKSEREIEKNDEEISTGI